MAVVMHSLPYWSALCMISEQPGDDLDGNVHGARPPHDQPRQAGPHPLHQELRRHHHQRSARNCLQSFRVGRIMHITVAAFNLSEAGQLTWFLPVIRI